MDPKLQEQLLEHPDPDEELEVLLRLAVPGQVPEKVRVVSDFGEVVTCRIRQGDVQEVYDSPLKLSLKAARLLTLGLPQEAAEGEEDEVDFSEDLPSEAPEPTPLPTGKGVVIGIIDWGMDFAHPDFLRPDGSTRLLAIWDQSAAQTSPGNPFGYGKIYLPAAINKALKSKTPYRQLGYHPAKGDTSGEPAHGTHVAGIAAAGGASGRTGVASEADLIFVHLSARDIGGVAHMGDSVRILEAIDFIRQTADNRPLVVNLSAGRHGAPRDGTSLVERAIDHFLESRPNTMLCQSGGNYFKSKAHTNGYVRPGKSASFIFRTSQADLTPNELEIWYSGRDIFELTLTNLDAGHSFVPGLGEMETIRFDGKVAGRIYHRKRDPNNGKNHVDLFLHPTAPAGNWRVTLSGERIVDGGFHASLERDGGCTGCQAVFADEDFRQTYTIGSLAGTHHSLVVGAVAKNLEPADFSSMGPTTDGRIKPDLVAPGVGIWSSRAAVHGEQAPPGGLVGMSGASMASPKVAGACILLLEVLPADTPFWVIRNLILGNTDPVQAAPGETMRTGSGALNIQKAVAAARLRAQATPPVEAQEATPFLTAEECPPTGVPSPEAPTAIVPDVPDDGGDKLESSDSDLPSDLSISTGGMPPEHENSPAMIHEMTAAEAPLFGEAIVRVGRFSFYQGATWVNVFADRAAPLHTSASFDEALEFAMNRTHQHAVITGDLHAPGGNFNVLDFQQHVSFIRRHVLLAQFQPDIACLVLNGMDAYLPENPLQPTDRWLWMPRMKEFYAFAAADQTRQRADWITALLRAGQHLNVPGQTVNRAYLQGLSTPVLRLLLANFAAHAYSISTVTRDGADRGGALAGATIPAFSFPLSEPDCYFPVIAQVEGKMEAVNAWDFQAGISSGPIQINTINSHIFHFLYKLWQDDRLLFNRELGTPHAWTMRQDAAGNPILTVNGGQPSAFELQGLPPAHANYTAEYQRNFAYFQSGDPAQGGLSQIVPAFRRTMAGHFRNVQVFPHVQEMLLEASRRYLAPGLALIHQPANGIPPLDTSHPDRDTFVLKALLLSAYVRYSGCLSPLLIRLRAYPAIAEKLAHWEDALNHLSALCRSLRERLRRQTGHAGSVFDAIQRMQTARPAHPVGTAPVASIFLHFPSFIVGNEGQPELEATESGNCSCHKNGTLEKAGLETWRLGAGLFDAFSAGKGKASMPEQFELLAAPGAFLPASARSQDILLTRVFGEGKLAFPTFLQAENAGECACGCARLAGSHRLGQDEILIRKK